MYPGNLFPRPFADNGNYRLIPDDKSVDGGASFKEGFPVETQLPLASGGVAPSRTDFNGILHMLSAFAFWQQSGGQWLYKATLDYDTPAVVFHAGALWWCLRPSGPVTGAVEPGTDKEYWIELAGFLSKTSSGGGISVQGYLTEFRGFYEQVPPQGWAVRDGSVLTGANTRFPALWEALNASANAWKCITLGQWEARQAEAGGVGGVPYFVLDASAGTVKLPDTRGDYEEGAGGGLAVGGWHTDAIRNIEGTVHIISRGLEKANGPFSIIHSGEDIYGTGFGYDHNNTLKFSAAATVPTADKNQPRAVGVLPCVYIGTEV
jgi:hypothetical protein